DGRSGVAAPQVAARGAIGPVRHVGDEPAVRRGAGRGVAAHVDDLIAEHRPPRGHRADVVGTVRADVRDAALSGHIDEPDLIAAQAGPAHLHRPAGRVVLIPRGRVVAGDRRLPAPYVPLDRGN